MKNGSSYILSIILFVFISLPAIAQKVSYDDDTIKVDGKVYAVMKKISAGPMRSDYSVRGSEGTELIYFKSELRTWYGSGFKFGNDEMYYEMTFGGTGSKVEITPKMKVGSGLAKLIVENTLVSGNMIDPVAEKRFVEINHGYTPSNSKPQPAPPPPAPTPPVVVNINNNNGTNGNGNVSTSPPTPPTAPVKSKSPVTINGKQIVRDGEVIGKFKQDTSASNYSQKMVIIMIYSEGGEKVAEATVPVKNPQEWSIFTLSDSKTSNILYDSPGERENLFRWLADKNYLTK